MFSHFQEAIVTSEEIGKDYEHVEAQQKKFDDFEKVRLFMTLGSSLTYFAVNFIS